MAAAHESREGGGGGGGGMISGVGVEVARKRTHERASNESQGFPNLSFISSPINNIK